MLRVALAITFALLASSAVRAQGDLSAANNVTDLEGTWSSNAAVSTGGVSPSSVFPWFLLACEFAIRCWSGHIPRKTRSRLILLPPFPLYTHMISPASINPSPACDYIHPADMLTIGIGILYSRRDEIHVSQQHWYLILLVRQFPKPQPIQMIDA